MTTMQLIEKNWYAYHMLPGYGEDFNPYKSPIRIDKIEPQTN